MVIWFTDSDHQRDLGKPSLIAKMTRQIFRDIPIDPDRVYIAGLSAGGAAAAIMAAAYPDMFAGVCLRFGLACGAARDFWSAIVVMRDMRVRHTTNYA
jgi:poly(3-hydroxybutyrate) depolymerase